MTLTIMVKEKVPSQSLINNLLISTLSLIDFYAFAFILKQLACEISKRLRIKLSST